MGWTCGTCGELDIGEYPLHGDDERWYCPRLDCPNAVTWVQSVDHNKATIAYFTKGAYGHKKMKPPTKDERNASARATHAGKLILAKMIRREKNKNGGHVEKKTKSKSKRASANRHGKCGMCGENKYLLKQKGEPETRRCTACFKAENPSTKPRKKRAKKKPPTVDEIAREVNAMETVARALENLPTDAVARVLRYAADRHQHKLRELLCLPTPVVQPQSQYPIVGDGGHGIAGSGGMAFKWDGTGTKPDCVAGHSVTPIGQEMPVG